MEHWEYNWVSASLTKKGWHIGGDEYLDSLGFKAHLDQLGKRGWELVSSHMINYNYHFFFFKRRLDPAQEARGGAGDASAD